ncbi:Uma2 family endonuclease [Silvibacterium acidisoli]|uniref:Uma2 family endonuclease n=1 Tax=Acidobacteriaceae bacterium ZG23-2 TaxID=2883246 RepID=UPI00406CCB8A
MSAVPHPVKLSVAEYLATSFRPDCDYVDGEIEERNLGEKEHSILQRYFTFLFTLKRDEWQIEGYPELRVQVSPSRFRIPDITVVPSGLESGSGFCAHRRCSSSKSSRRKILSKRLRQRVDDYFKFGTEHVWVVDPDSRKAHVYTKTGMQEPEGGVLTIPGTEIRVQLSELFAELDRA